MHLSATSNAEQNFGTPLLEVHFQRYERESFLLALLSELDDLALVQQKFSFPPGLVIEELAGIGVGRNLAIDQENLAINDMGKRFGQLQLPIAEALYFATGKLDATLQVLQNLVFMPSLAVLANAFLVLVFFFFRSF